MDCLTPETKKIYEEDVRDLTVSISDILSEYLTENNRQGASLIAVNSLAAATAFLFNHSIKKDRRDDALDMFVFLVDETLKKIDACPKNEDS